MAEADKRAMVKFVTSTGRKHEFDMAADKALMFAQQVSGQNMQGSTKTWLDMWDYTENANGQFLINTDSIESVVVEAVKSSTPEPQPRETAVSQ